MTLFEFEIVCVVAMYFTNILQDYFIGIGSLIWLCKYKWINPEELITLMF